MKAHPLPVREFIVTARKQGKTFSAIAQVLRMPTGTVKSIDFYEKRRHSTKHSTDLTEGKTSRHSTKHSTGEWMQSLHHESAHFVINGVPACSNGPKGANIVAGMRWFPHDGCLRKCTRCMGAVNKEAHQPSQSEV